VFLPFYKGENGFTGIGLAIVDKIVKLYNGYVRIDGNGGACFEFSLKDS
jgi:signal transduction histidine kinase